MGSLRNLVCNHTARDYHARKFYWHLETKKEVMRFLKKEYSHLEIIVAARSERSINDKTKTVRSIFVRTYGSLLPHDISKFCLSAVETVCNRKHYDTGNFTVSSGTDYFWASEQV
jgi:hypothetical protein